MTKAFPTPVSHGRRRVPRQIRAVATAEAICQAACELVEKSRIHAVTTNHVAERAGVSIGSLYQYFTSVEGILISAYEDASAAAATHIQRMVRKHSDRPFDEFIHKMIFEVLKMYERNRFILVDLPEEVLELRQLNKSMSYGQLVRGTTRAVILQNTDHISEEELNRRIFLTEHMVHDTLRSFVRDAPPKVCRKALCADVAAFAINSMSARRDWVHP